MSASPHLPVLQTLPAQPLPTRHFKTHATAVLQEPRHISYVTYVTYGVASQATLAATQRSQPRKGDAHTQKLLLPLLVHEQKQTRHRCCCCSRPPPELVLLHLIHQAAGVTQNKCSGAATSDTSQSRQQPIQQGINQSTAVDKTQSSISSALPVNASSPPSCQHIRQAAQPVTAGVTNLP